MPSGVIVMLTASWRVFSRLYMVVEVGAVAMASLGLAAILGRLSTVRTRLLATLILISLVLFEFLTFGPGRTPSFNGRSMWNYDKAPRVYHQLASVDEVDTIAEYPLVEPPRNYYYNYLTYQLIHGKKLINTSRANSPQAQLRETLSDPRDPEVLPILRAMGVDRLFWHSSQPLEVEGLRLLEYDDVVANDPIWVYQLEAGPIAEIPEVNRE